MNLNKVVVDIFFFGIHMYIIKNNIQVQGTRYENVRKISLTDIEKVFASIGLFRKFFLE